MKIGELASRAGLPVETIRFYEAQGLMPVPARTAANYRRYDEAHLERLLFIRHCRALDMNLPEVRTLLEFRDNGQADCTEVNTLLDDHIGHVEARITELQALEHELRTLRARCVGEKGPCAIIDALADLGGRLGGPTDTHVGSVHGQPPRRGAG